MSKRSRAGVTVVEVLVAVAILAAGMFPIFTLYRGARTGIGISRAMVELQDEAHGQLAAAKVRIRTGQLRAEEVDGEVVEEATRGEVRSKVTVTSSLRLGRLLTVKVRVERKDRFYEAYEMVSDPFGVLNGATAPGGEP